ncbi:MAG: DegV family protein [Patescibacteria group bacterium]
MSESDYYNTIILTDDLGVKSESEIPLKLNSQILKLDLVTYFRDKERQEIYFTDGGNETGLRYFQNLFNKESNKNKYIVYLSSSSELTRSYKEALLARSKSIFKKNIFIIDTKQISGGVVLVKLYLEALLKEGLALEESIPKLYKYIRKIHGSILMTQKKSNLIQKPLLNFEERIQLKFFLSLGNDSKLIIDKVMKYEKDHKINSIFISHFSDKTKRDASIIKVYIEKVLRYYDKVHLIDSKHIQEIDGIALHIG